MKDSHENPSQKPPETPPQAEPAPEVKLSPEEMAPQEKVKIVIAFNLKKEFANVTSKEIGGAIYRYLKSNKKDEDRWMEKYSPVLDMPVGAKWADWKGKVTPLLLKDLRLPPGSDESVIKIKEQDNWLNENWSSPEERDKILKTYSHLGDKRRAWLNNPHYYIEDWKEIDRKMIKEAFTKAYGGEAEKAMREKNLPEPDGHLTEEGLKDIVPRAFALRGEDKEAREERMSDAVDARGVSFASNRLFEQLQRGEITRIATGALDEDAKSALYFMTKLNKFGGQIKSVSVLKNGEWMRDAINLDTGHRDAGLTGEGFKTYFFEHHQAKKTIATSAVEGVYKFLIEHDLIPGASPSEVELNKKWMGNLVKFINEVDNYDFDRSSFNETFYKGEWRNSLYGLRRYMSVDDLMEIFQKGGPDFDYRAYRMGEADAKRIIGTHIGKDPITGQDETFTGPLEEVMKLSQKDINSSVNTVKDAEAFMKKNKISQTHHYLGNVLVNYNKPEKYELGGPDVKQTRKFESKDPVHNEAPYAFGYDTFINYSESEDKIFIQSRFDLGPIYEKLQALSDKDARLENIRGIMILTIKNKKGRTIEKEEGDKEGDAVNRFIATIQRLGLWDRNADFFDKHDRDEATALNEVVREPDGSGGDKPVDNPTILATENAFRAALDMSPDKKHLFEKIDLDELKYHSLLIPNLKEAMQMNITGGDSRFKIELNDLNREYRKDVYAKILEKNLKILGIKARLITGKSDSIEVIINPKSSVESLDEAGQKALIKYALENGLNDLLDSGENLSWSQIISKEVEKLGLPEAVNKLDAPDALAMIRKGKTQTIEAEDYKLTLREFLGVGLDKEPRNAVKNALRRAITEGWVNTDRVIRPADLEKVVAYLGKLDYTGLLSDDGRSLAEVRKKTDLPKPASQPPRPAERKDIPVPLITPEEIMRDDINKAYSLTISGLVGLTSKAYIANIDKKMAIELKLPGKSTLIGENRSRFVGVPTEWVKELIKERKNDAIVKEYPDNAEKTEWKKKITEALGL